MNDTHNFKIHEDMGYIQKNKRQLVKVLGVCIIVGAVGYLFIKSNTIDQAPYSTHTESGVSNNESRSNGDGYAGFQAPSQNDFNNLPQAPSR